jgi:hypothetical protein
MTCTKESFLRDVADHVVEVIRNEGVNRHIRFRKPGTMCFHFDLITWPGYLCYTGDMGTYVFRRLEDMFQFFRTKPYANRDPLDQIDRRYWAEKLEATNKHGGHLEFDKDTFQREITEQRRKLFVEHGKDMAPVDRQEFWSSLEDVKHAADEGEHRTFSEVQDWSFTYYKPRLHTTSKEPVRVYLSTDEFPSCKTYTYYFLWCCYALAWGIQQFDALTTPEPALAA